MGGEQWWRLCVLKEQFDARDQVGKRPLKVWISTYAETQTTRKEARIKVRGVCSKRSQSENIALKLLTPRNPTNLGGRQILSLLMV